MEPQISSLEQHKWVTKLFGYDYEIIYKNGKENVVVDALSRKYEDAFMFIYYHPKPKNTMVIVIA